MRNKDIFTIQRHLFIKKVPLRMSVMGVLRTHIRTHMVMDCLSMVGLLALVALALALQEVPKWKELSPKPALGGGSQKESGYRLSVGA